ncbi:hypothetical protein M6B38_348000 [Iris pallida]|uniref:Uncharacterized protein n=1 Tax=Iris pallida TaxID=29817 RepID=A0AAX6GTN4_IRIPA|nr:hypothetical protein M6B38_348000 [Iris pallida]
MHLSSNPTPCKPPLLDDHPGRRPWPTRRRLLLSSSSMDLNHYHSHTMPNSSSSWSSADLPDPSHPRLAVVQCAAHAVAGRRRSCRARPARHQRAAAAAAALERARVNDVGAAVVVAMAPATPAVGGPPSGRLRRTVPWRPPSSGTRRRGDSCVLNDVPS